MQQPRPDGSVSHFATVAELRELGPNAASAGGCEAQVRARVLGLQVDGEGHAHFDLADDSGRVEAMMPHGAAIHLRFRPAEGQQVLARGKFESRPPEGAPHFVVHALEPHDGSDFAHGWRAAEERTRLWLETSYRDDFLRVGDSPQEHRTYEPDGRVRRMTGYQFHSLLRKLKVFRLLDRLKFETLIDIGSGIDTYPYLARARYGVPVYSADLAYWVNMPFEAPPHGKLDHAVTLSVTRLPFADGTFDVVLASEVLEHLVRPIEAIAEMMRVARKYVVLTSLEALSVGRAARLRSRLHVDPRLPHVERNFFVLDEIEAIFGAGLHHENLFFDPELPATQFAPADVQEAAYAPLNDSAALVHALCRAGTTRDHSRGAMGIVLVAAKPGKAVAPPAGDDAPLARWLIERCAASEEAGFRLLERVRRGGDELLPERDHPVAAELLAHLACPDCRSRLDRVDRVLRCPRCEVKFPVAHGVPILYPHTPPSDTAMEEEARRQLCGGDAIRWRKVRSIMRSLRRGENEPAVIHRALRAIERLKGGG